MSFKTYSKIFPVILNSLKGKQVPLNGLSFEHIGKYPSAAVNLCNHINSKLYSTKPHAELKQIYYGVLTPQIKAVKIFSLSSSIVGIIGQPFLYNEIVSTGNVPIIIAAYSVIGFFTFLTPLLLHLITKRYVTHLFYNEETDAYIARTVNFFCRTKETEFKPDDVVVPDVPGAITSFLIKGKPVLVDVRFFQEPDHYGRIMGYDKPIDFKLHESPPEAPDINKKSV